MKILMAVLLATLAFAGQPQQGQRTVSSQWIKWDPGSSDADTTTKIVLNNAQVLADSSGTLKRIDNTADSCSYPFAIGVMDASQFPIWYQAIFLLVDADDEVATTTGFVVETRNRIRIKNSAGKYLWAWDEWIKYGFKVSSSDITVDDSVAVVAPGVSTKIRQELRFSTLGDQARLCPSDFGGFGATDTTEIDSIYYIGR